MEMGDLVKKLLLGGLALVAGLAILVAVFKLTLILITAAIPLALLGGAAYLGYRWWTGRALRPGTHRDEGSERW